MPRRRCLRRIRAWKAGAVLQRTRLAAQEGANLSDREAFRNCCLEHSTHHPAVVECEGFLRGIAQRRRRSRPPDRYARIAAKTDGGGTVLRRRQVAKNSIGQDY